MISHTLTHLPFACFILPQFVYCQSAFAPPPDERMSDVKACFAQNTDGVLILHYCLQPAWG